MKLLVIWFCGNQGTAKGASEDRLAHLSICWRQTLGSPGTACWQWWMTGLAGERAMGGHLKLTSWYSCSSSSSGIFCVSKI